jgi:hypothetical protein
VKTDIVDVAAHAQAHERFVLLVPVDRKRSEGLSCEFCCDDVLAVTSTVAQGAQPQSYDY